MVTIRLYQRTDKVRPDGRAPIYYVLAKGRERKYISTKKYLNPSHFDNKSGLVLRGEQNSIKLNAFFKRQMTRLDDIIIDLVNEGQDPTFEKIESRFLNDASGGFITFALAELEEQKGLIEYKTYVGYKNRLDNLKKSHGDFPIHKVTHEFLMSLKNYWILKKRSANGFYQDFATIKKFFRAAVVKGFAKGNPFENFRLEKEETSKAWLTNNELLKLRELLGTHQITDAEKNTLRHFLFSCFCGIRFGDKQRFDESNIVDGRIQLKQGKTGKYIMVPFSEWALELLPYILKYRLKQSNTRVNDDLEVCMDEAKIKKHITYHCSRHTFAINCLLAGIDLITVRDWLGHKSVTTTEIYAKIAAQYKDNSILKLDGYWNNTSAEKPVTEISIPQIDDLKRELAEILPEVMDMKNKGMTNVAIAQKFGVSETAVRKWLKRDSQTATPQPNQT